MAHYDRIARYVLLGCLLLFQPSRLHADVTIQGNLYYWNQEPASAQELEAAPDFEGRYLPLRETYLQVEFDATTEDVELFSDENGFYSVTKRNPLVGNWHVNLEIRAEVRLSPTSVEGSMVRCFPGHTAFYAYNCQTASIAVGKNETLTLDLYLGGPQSNIAGYWNDRDDTLIAFFNCQAIRHAYLSTVLVEHSRVAELARPTVLIYPGDSEQTHFEPFTPPPSRAHIQVAKLNASSVSPIANAQEWRDHRGGLAHEFGHKIMSDLYWALPRTLPDRIKFWECYDSNHDPLLSLSPELAFVEGWAEFYAAWIFKVPTLNGTTAVNLEHAWHPSLELPDNVGSFLVGHESGQIAWREMIVGERQNNESENAAVLWDLVDPIADEYLPLAQQQAKPTEWPAPLKFKDSLEDPQLLLLWDLLKSGNPDCLLDEGDLWEDSLHYYWLSRFASDPVRLHGFKAVLFNRGIKTTKQPENAPTLQVVSGVATGNTVRLQVAEQDTEDRAQLRFNLAIQAAPDRPYRLVFPADRLLSSTDFRPDETGTGEFSLTLPESWYRAIVLVHDNMLPVFESIENPDYRPSDEPGSGTASPFTLMGSWSDGPDGHDLGYWNGYVYLCQDTYGLQIIDIADPTNPQAVKKLFDPARDKHNRLTIREAPAFRGSYAYVPTPAELRIFDIAELPGIARDVTLTQPQTPPWANAIGDTVYWARGIDFLAQQDDILFLRSASELYSRRTLQPPQGMEFLGFFKWGRSVVSGQVPPRGTFSFQDMDVRDNVLGGISLPALSFFDVSDPTAPRLKSFYPLEHGLRVRLHPPFAFAITQESWIVIDYRDIENPRLVWQQPPGDRPQSLDIYENWLVVACNRKDDKTNPRLMLFDIQDPAQPRFVGEWMFGHNQPLGHYGYPTTVKLHYLYPGTSFQGIYALVSCVAQDEALMLFRLSLPEP